MPAERCVEVLRNKLNAFGLNLDEDIVCIITEHNQEGRKTNFARAAAVMLTVFT